MYQCVHSSNLLVFLLNSHRAYIHVIFFSNLPNVALNVPSQASLSISQRNLITKNFIISSTTFNDLFNIQLTMASTITVSSPSANIITVVRDLTTDLDDSSPREVPADLTQQIQQRSLLGEATLKVPQNNAGQSVLVEHHRPRILVYKKRNGETKSMHP